MSTYEQQDFDFWWQLQGQWIEPPNNRRGGSSGVIRLERPALPPLYIKRQEGHIFRSFRYPLGRPTCLREARALERFRAIGIIVPRTHFFGLRKAEKWCGVLVTESLPEGSISFDEFYSQSSTLANDQHLRQEIAHALAQMLARLHRHRWQHSSLMTKHIFVRITACAAEGVSAGVELALLDLERARQWLTVARASRRDIHFLKEHLPFWSNEEWQVFDRIYRQALL